MEKIFKEHIYKKISAKQIFLRDGEFAPTDRGLKRMWINKIILTDILNKEIDLCELRWTLCYRECGCKCLLTPAARPCLEEVS